MSLQTTNKEFMPWLMQRCISSASLKEGRGEQPEHQHVAELQTGLPAGLKQLEFCCHFQWVEVTTHHSSTEVTSNTCKAKVFLGLKGPQGPEELFMFWMWRDFYPVSYLWLKCCVCTQIQGPEMGPVWPFFVPYLKCSLQAGPSPCMPAGSKQDRVSLHPPSCPYSSISSDLTTLEWDFTSGRELTLEQSNTATFWLISSGVPSACEGRPCCDHGFSPPHALVTAAAGAGQGAKGPWLCFLPGGPRCFLLLQLSVECCSLAVLKLLESLHSLHVPLK